MRSSPEFMLPASSLIAFTLTLFVAAGSPGPTVGALVACVLTRGFRSVLPFLLAMWLGEAVWLTVAVMGLATIAAKFAMIFSVLKLLGVAYLLSLAWRMWNTTRDTELTVAREPQSAWQTFLAGLMITLGNPKIAIFYLALLPSLVNLGRITVEAWGELTVLTLLILAGVDLAWSTAAARTRQLLINRRATCITNRVGATVMAGAAVAIAVQYRTRPQRECSTAGPESRLTQRSGLPGVTRATVIDRAVLEKVLMRPPDHGPVPRKERAFWPAHIDDRSR